jgi:pentatricopeptide repeat protein
LALEACARRGYSDTAFSIIESMLSHGKEIREKNEKR